MNMIRQAFSLWKQERSQKGTSLQRRLIIFFALIAVFIILSFTSLLLVFDMTGSGGRAVYSYTDNELSHLYTSVTNDFGTLSVQAVSLAEEEAAIADSFFTERGIKASELSEYPELLEPLLSEQIDSLISIMEHNICSGVFIILDATVNPDAENADFSKAGIFIKKTQPDTALAVGAKNHFLRGPASVARDNYIELLGQWHMEFDVSDEDFYMKSLTNARENPDKLLSRLYYWSDRTILKDNSEAGFMLCVPLRSSDNSVFGLCGIEISDRMFKQFYSPHESDYNRVFTLMAPSSEDILNAKKGMLAGNTYLTANRIESEMLISEGRNGFSMYSTDTDIYGGLHARLRLYPTGSVFEDEYWTLAIMMPYELLSGVISGNTPYLLGICILLLLTSIFVSIFISRRYLRPVTDALDRIKTGSYSTDVNSPYFEINDLMEFLAKQDEEAKNAPVSIAEPVSDVTPMFKEFLVNVKTLSPAERSVFDLYIKGYKAQEIAEKLFLSINTIKTHNRRIFAKLNVASRNELLVYIDMMKEMKLI